MFAVVLIAGVFLATPAHAATVPIEIAVDASGSMNAQIGSESRMDIAKRTVKEVFEGLDANIALRAFGHTYGNTEAEKAQSCTDTELLLDFGGTSADVIKAVDALEPSGWTPLALTIEKAGEDLKAIKEETGEKPVLIVLSDGLDSCDGDPEAEAKKLIAAGVDVTIHVIGLAVDAETEASLKALATAGGGTYVTATNASELKAGFEAIVEEEGVEGKEASDVISGTRAENIISGGSTFEDAKPFPTELLGEQVSLSEHLKYGAAETFTFDVKADQILYVTVITGELGVAEKDGVFGEGPNYVPWSAMQFFSSDKVSIDRLRFGGAKLSKGDDRVVFPEDDTIVMSIGSSGLSSSYGIHKDTRYIFSFDDPSKPKPESTPDENEEGADGEAMDSGEESGDESEKESEMPFDKNLLYIAAGLLALFFIWMIVRSFKK